MEGLRLQTERAGAYTRVETDVRGQIEAPVDDVWSLFVEWSAIHRWMKAPTSPRDVASSDLVEGHSEDRLPRTRMIRFSGAHPSDPPVRETLLHADPEARTLYYNLEGVRPTGMRNYLCYTTMQALTDGSTLLRLHARFDVPSEMDVNAVRDGIAAVHRDGIIGAFRLYLGASRSDG